MYTFDYQSKLYAIASFDKQKHTGESIRIINGEKQPPILMSSAETFFAKLAKILLPSDFDLLHRNVGDGRMFNIADTIFVIHLKDNGSYKPYYIEFFNEPARVVCTLREASNYSNDLTDALYATEQLYLKIIRANLDTNEFKEVKIYENEKPTLSHFSSWAAQVAENFVFETDREAFLKFIDCENIVNSILADKPLTFSYRRWYKNQWIIVLLRVIPCTNFSSDNPEVMFYLSKIS